MSRVASGIAIQGNTQFFADFKVCCRKLNFPHPQPLSQGGRGGQEGLRGVLPEGTIEHRLQISLKGPFIGKRGIGIVLAHQG